jgi:hypothetical protein
MIYCSARQHTPIQTCAIGNQPALTRRAASKGTAALTVSVAGVGCAPLGSSLAPTGLGATLVTSRAASTVLALARSPDGQRIVSYQVRVIGGVS